MKILSDRVVNGRRHVCYLSDRQGKGYVWHMSSESRLNPEKLKFRGWLCPVSAWEKTFKKIAK